MYSSLLEIFYNCFFVEPKKISLWFDGQFNKLKPNQVQEELDNIVDYRKRLEARYQNNINFLMNIKIT